MICTPCKTAADTGTHHDDCEDQKRERAWSAWLRAEFKGRVIGPTEKRLIEANRPYPSCTCLHRVQAQPVDSPQGTPDP